MKTLLVCINKGGVGKTLIACQLARYARQLGLKVLVIDFDDQGNTTKSLERDQSVQRLPLTVTQVMFQHEPSMKPDESGFSLLAADGSFNIALVEQARVKMQVDGEDVEKAVVAHQNFGAFLEDMQAHFDLCIIDGPPTGDVRITMALAQATAVVCPIQLAQESIEGMGDTLKGRRGILRVKAEMNPKLDFLGFLPNMVESTPKQRDALKSLSKALGEYFLRDEDGIIVTMPRRESLRDAQGQGALLAELGKAGNTAARETWNRVKRVFDLLLERLDLADRIEALQEKERQAAKLRRLYQRKSAGDEGESDDDDVLLQEVMAEEA